MSAANAHVQHGRALYFCKFLVIEVKHEKQRFIKDNAAGMKDENKVVRGIAINRRNLIELIVSAILLAFGINLLAGQVLNWLQIKPLLVFLLGSLLCFFAIGYTFFSLFGRRTKKTTFKAFIAYNPMEKELISVPRYDYAQGLDIYVSAAFAENEALKIRWDRQPLEPYKFFLIDKDGKSKKVGREVLSQMRWAIDGSHEMILPPDGQLATDFLAVSPSENETARLLVEATEYYLLEKLSTHLKGYFDDEKFNESKLVEFARKNIPSVLLSNIFLEQFSRPMIERLAFVEEALNPRQKEEGLESIGLMSFKHGGSWYHNFCLVLPKGSTIKRPHDYEIEIETRKLKIRLATCFNGSIAALDNEFMYYYLGYANLFDIFTYQILIDIHISVKLGALFTSSGWEYYHWIDSFLEEIEQAVSQDAFFKRINWETTLTHLQCEKRLSRQTVTGSQN
jgi:hypothetical protein